MASLPGVGTVRLEGWGPYFGVSGVILEIVHRCAERFGVGAQDRHGERRTAGRMLVLRSWEAVEKTSFAPAAQCRAPGM